MQRILLADNNPDLRSALRLLLKTRFGLESIFEASDMESLLVQLETTNPDCVILEWELPGRPEGERIELLRFLAPRLKIICKTEPPSVILNVIQKLCLPELRQS